MSNATRTKTISVDFIGVRGQVQQTAIFDRTISQTILMSDTRAKTLGFPTLDGKQQFTTSNNEIIKTQERIGFMIIKGQLRGIVINTVPQNIPTFVGRKFLELFDLQNL